MRRIITIIILNIFFLSAFLFSGYSYDKKKYRIVKVSIKAALTADGAMDVTEERSYDFSGKFSYAYRTFPTDGKVTFNDFMVSEQGEYYHLSDSEEPGTFSIRQKDEKTEVRWYFEAKNQQRIFTFQYKAFNAVNRYRNVAELYYQFISSDWKIPQENISITVRPPRQLSKESLEVWQHTQEGSELLIREDGTVRLDVPAVEKNKIVELRLLYPQELFGAVSQVDQLRRDAVLAEESEYNHQVEIAKQKAAQDQLKLESRLQYGIWIMSGFSLLMLAFWWLIYRVYGKRTNVRYSEKFSSDIPSKTPPALIEYLLRGTNTGLTLASTLLDMARRGFLELHEEESKKIRIIRGKKTNKEYTLHMNNEFIRGNSGKLLNYEASLIKFIFHEFAGRQTSVSLTDMKKRSSKFIKFFQLWRKEIKTLGKKQKWFDAKSFKGMIISLILAGFTLICGIASVFFFLHLALIPVGTAIVLFLLSLVIHHRTLEGELLARKWRALKRFLVKKKYQQEKMDTVYRNIDKFIIYGIVFGMQERQIRQLIATIPPEKAKEYFPWYRLYGEGKQIFSPEVFATGFAAMISSTTASVSVAAGAAAGAAGGGAASGGGGAG